MQHVQWSLRSSLIAVYHPGEAVVNGAFGPSGRRPTDAPVDEEPFPT
ncbi:hypothetical protein [Nocardiopsis potens]|nr:hypothetical protein [Nocardiopsis potens]